MKGFRNKHNEARINPNDTNKSSLTLREMYEEIATLQAQVKPVESYASQLAAYNTRQYNRKQRGMYSQERYEIRPQSRSQLGKKTYW